MELIQLNQQKSEFISFHIYQKKKKLKRKTINIYSKTVSISFRTQCNQLSFLNIIVSKKSLLIINQNN